MKLSGWAYKGMLLAAAAVWGLGFVVMKGAVDVFSPATLVGWRFLLAALITLVAFFGRIRGNLHKSTIVAGVVVGALYFLGFWTQTVGLTDTTPGKNAFLTATYCVLVPFAFWIIAGKKPRIITVLAAVVCLVGVGLVSMDGGFTMRFGDMMTLVCAIFFALQIAFLGKYAKNYDVITITFFEFLTCGLMGLGLGFATEAQPTLADGLSASSIALILYLGIVASFAAGLAQNVGQAHVPPSQASLILCLESVFGVAFSVLIYGESLTPRLILGFAVIFAAIVANEMLADKEFTRGRKR